MRLIIMNKATFAQRVRGRLIWSYYAFLTHLRIVKKMAIFLVQGVSPVYKIIKFANSSSEPSYKIIIGKWRSKTRKQK